MAGLEQDQPVRKHMDPDGYEKIEKFTGNIKGHMIERRSVCSQTFQSRRCHVVI